jgi:hypothetical protein
MGLVSGEADRFHRTVPYTFITVLAVGFFECQAVCHVYSLPFTFHQIQNVGLEKLTEIVPGDSHVDIVVHLHGDTDPVALADTEAAHKHYLILQMLFINDALHPVNNLLGALQITGASHTYLNDDHILHLGEYFFFEKFVHGIGIYGEHRLIHQNAHALLASADAEGAAQFHLVADFVLGNQILQLLNDLTGALDVAGASDAYCNLNHTFLLFFRPYGAGLPRSVTSEVY